MEQHKSSVLEMNTSYKKQNRRRNRIMKYHTCNILPSPVVETYCCHLVQTNMIHFSDNHVHGPHQKNGGNNCDLRTHNMFSYFIPYNNIFESLSNNIGCFWNRSVTSTLFVSYTSPTATTEVQRTTRRKSFYSNRLRILFFNFIFISLMNQFLCSMSYFFVQADWIDPDTPLEVRTTFSIDAKQYIPPPHSSPDDSTTTTTIRYKNYTTPTSVPTTAPISSTISPTSRPTVLPTKTPTNTHNVYDLVFSDEFNVPGRTFQDGADPRWTALDKNDYTNDALHYYSPENVYTNNDGHLVIETTTEDTEIVGYDDVQRIKTHVTKHFKSGMMQSWNKFCFTGGIIEAQAILPGKSTIGGLWPAFWMLGNLARHTYVGSSEHIWPWASQQCTAKSATAQKVSGCQEVVHYGMKPHVGRGAPEIDIFEVQPGNMHANKGVFLKTSVGQPFMSASYQVAPGRSANRPGPGEWPGPDQWYSGTKFGVNTSLNILFYGAYNHFNDDTNPLQQDYWSDAISYNRQLNEDYFQKPHIYRLEWDVPVENVTDGYLHWFIDGELVSSISGAGIKQAGLGSELSSEPSYILLNTAVSKQWGFPHECPSSCPCKEYNCNSNNWEDICGFSEGFCDMMTDSNNVDRSSYKNGPIQYKIDWIRVYQDKTKPAQKVGCSTPERPTRKFIVANEKKYMTEDDEHPLKGIPRGLGSCDPNTIVDNVPNNAVVENDFEKLTTKTTSDMPASVRIIQNGEIMKVPDNVNMMELLPRACGGTKRGRCTSGNVCECYTNWTGPYCMSQDGYDPILYDVVEKITDVGFVLPKPNTALVFVFVGIALLLLIVIRNQKVVQTWQPVPDVDMKHHSESGTNGMDTTAKLPNSISKRRLSV